MSTETMELCERVLKTARDAGTDACRVAFSKQRAVSVEYRDGKPETVEEATTRRLRMELFVGGRYLAQSTSDLRQESLKAFVRSGIDSAVVLEEDPFRSLPDPSLYAGRTQQDLQLRDPAYEKMTPARRHAMAGEMEAACRQAGGETVVSVNAGIYDTLSEKTVLASDGFSGELHSTRYAAYASMTAQDQGDRRPSSYHVAVSRTLAPLTDTGAIGTEAASRTRALMGSRKLPTETLPIIIENRNTGRILDGFVTAMSGWSLQQKRSFLLDRKGEKIGSDSFTLVDDPHIPGGLGSRPYDGDGFATRKRAMIDKGILESYYIDWYRSRKLGVAPTTGSVSNLVLPPGSRSVPRIMKDLGRGILINGFVGGNANSNTGDFSFGITGTLFDGGEPAGAVAEMNIAGNHLSFWEKLAEAANDPWTCSRYRIPSLVFTDVVVSGR